MAPTIVLISGANRSLCLSLLKRYLVLPDYIVIAANRSPEHTSSNSLADLRRGDGSQLIVVKVDAMIEQDAFDAVRTLQDKHGITHLDIVIADSGLLYVWPPVSELKLDDPRAHMAPNVYGCIALYQATRSLMKKSTREPIFSPIGSSAGCITDDSRLNTFVMDPGLVQTDLGNAGAVHFGLPHAPQTVDETCDPMIKVFSESSKQKHETAKVEEDEGLVEDRLLIRDASDDGYPFVHIYYVSRKDDRQQYEPEKGADPRVLSDLAEAASLSRWPRLAWRDGLGEGAPDDAPDHGCVCIGGTHHTHESRLALGSSSVSNDDDAGKQPCTTSSSDRTTHYQSRAVGDQGVYKTTELEDGEGEEASLTDVEGLDEAHEVGGAVSANAA
ncbi:hypothetical protein F4778DRAFT_786925 [Xylariomycetidae sp. FL2044]|nr:hypothetical protein F4778DRAFT_786925 [Xylariomycetidae sp. FL2044]